jgi:hypothetical protein
MAEDEKGLHAVSPDAVQDCGTPATRSANPDVRRGPDGSSTALFSLSRRRILYAWFAFAFCRIVARDGISLNVLQEPAEAYFPRIQAIIRMEERTSAHCFSCWGSRRTFEEVHTLAILWGTIALSFFSETGTAGHGEVGGSFPRDSRIATRSRLDLHCADLSHGINNKRSETWDKLCIIWQAPHWRRT